MNRRSFLQSASATAVLATVGNGHVFAATPVNMVYGPAQVFNIPVYVPIELGFAQEEGLDLSLTLIDAGTQVRDTLAAEQAMFAMTDIVNALQLQNRGKPTKALITAAQVPFYGNYVIRKDLYDQGIDTLEKFVEWKRPDGSKPNIGISTMGGSIYTLGTFIFENLGAADKVNWVALGTNAGMLGGLASKQVDLIPAASSALYDARENGWGEVILDVTKPDQVAKYIGGDFPGLSFFTLDSTIERQPEVVQAFVNATYRGMQWLKDASVDEIHERFVNKYIQGLSPEGSRREIEYMKQIWNYDCQTRKDVFENGGRIWYREATGITPIAYEDAVAPQFVDNAAKS